jgi:hypothetical protein
MNKKLVGGSIILLLLASMVLVMDEVGNHEVSAQSEVKDMRFYMHYSQSAVNVGGVSTNFIINSLYAFPSTAQSFYKAVGQPKITEDFYFYPPFAGTVELNGNWEVIVFANSTALHPATWGVEFWEKSSNGSIVWDSGAITPTVQGGPAGNPGYVDSPIYGYTLIASDLSHNFTAGDTLEIEVSVNVGSTVPLTLWYDSPTYPSGIILPSMNYAQPVGIHTEDVNGTARTVFFAYWSASERQVIIQSEVADPFGGYDVAKVFVQVNGPSGNIVVTNTSMEMISGNSYSFNQVYQYTFSYSSNASEGTYTVSVFVVDNNGVHQYDVFGYYQPYITSLSGHFSIGIQVPVIFELVSASTQPVSGALIEVYSGGLPLVSGYSGPSGSANLTVFQGNLEVKVFWRRVMVADQAITVYNSSTVLVPVNVLDPTFSIVSFDGNPVSSALLFITYPNGTTGRLPFTSNQNGVVNLYDQPGGTYSLLVLYENVEVDNSNATLNVMWNNSSGVPTPNPVQPAIITTNIYDLIVNVKDDSGLPVNNATVVIKAPNLISQMVYGYGTTSNGTVSFLLPPGNYNVLAMYHGVWWLTYASNQTTVAVHLVGDQHLSIQMNNIPPPIWLTVGFWLIFGVVATAIILGFVFVRLRRKVNA